MAGPGSRRSFFASNLALPCLAGALPLAGLSLLLLPQAALAAVPQAGVAADAAALVALSLLPPPPLSTTAPEPPPAERDATGGELQTAEASAAQPSPAPTLLAQAVPSSTDPPAASEPPTAQPSAPAEAAPAAEPTAPAPSDGAQTPAATPTTPALQPQSPPEPRVLVSEVVIEGLEGPRLDAAERERLERAVYGAMKVTPGSETTRSELRNDLAAIYATGWFADVRIDPVDSPLGVRLRVQVVPNPVLTSISLDPGNAKLPRQVVDDTFAGELGKTINSNTLQTRLQDLQKWYADQGYSLARISGPGRISPDGAVQLLIREGSVEAVEVQFLNKEGSATNDKGEPIRGKTKPWVISREISIKPGEVFNRRNLEEDLKRLYGTGLFSDVKVTLRPAADNSGRMTIVLGIVEQSTGSLSGGLGYSQSQGVFGQIQLQETNLMGRAWDLATSFTYGQFGGLADITFTDPWIKGDPFRTAFRVKAFISRDVPQVFQSQDNGNILTASDFYKAPGTRIAYDINSSDNPLRRRFGSVDDAVDANDNLSWVDFNGNSAVIQRIGGNLQIVRPLNSGNPYKRAPWSVILGLSAQEVSPIDFSGAANPYGVASDKFRNGNNAKVPTNAVICLAYNCAEHNQLFGLRVAATMNNLNDPRNPTSGNFLSLGTEQFISLGQDSPTFNRLRGSYTHYVPVNWLKLYKGCRPKPGESRDCKQALAFQVSAGTSIGSLPPYEAFCLGGGNSVRGFYDCNLGVGRSFGEATIEYRFPIFSIISGELFVDGGTTFGSQSNVPGNPGGLLGKPGEGFSVGTGLIVTTPVGPLRLEVASKDFSGDWRFNLGVGWKF
ncbi:MAG: BamA/TamA family outer membrane protein [Cyanobium sp.]